MGHNDHQERNRWRPNLAPKPPPIREWVDFDTGEVFASAEEAERARSANTGDVRTGSLQAELRRALRLVDELDQGGDLDDLRECIDGALELAGRGRG